MNPRYPFYIPSKSRSHNAATPGVLEQLGIPHLIVVEQEQYDDYANAFGKDRLLVLDRSYQEQYDTFDNEGDALSKGPGPARNFIWDHSISEGHDWHWVMDDNIRLFARLHENQRIPIGDGLIFHAMETFALRYKNVGMVGPDYWFFAPSRAPAKPYVLNTRIFSCNLIRNNLDQRWRGRYNEDLDISIRILKAGWCTVLFKAFLQDKTVTQVMKGGNTEAFYEWEGTLRKSRMAVRMHPEMIKLVRRYNRWHHYADLSQFKVMGLVRNDESEEFDYGSSIQPRNRVLH